MRLFDQQCPGTLEDVSILRRTLRRELVSLHLADELTNDIELAVAELTTNSVVHGRPAPRIVGLQIDLVQAALRFELTDDGGGFENFEAVWGKSAFKDLNDLGPTGLGLTLARTTLSNVAYYPGSPNRLIGWRPLARKRPAILIVEDDQSLLKLMTALLQQRYRVYAATTVAAALDVVSIRRVDLVIADFHLGSDNALRLLEKIEQQPDQLPIPVIITSADPTFLQKAYLEGAVVEHFIEKPIKVAALRNAVERAMYASTRRTISMLRYFGANADTLVQGPSDESLRKLNIRYVSAGATHGSGDFVIHLPAEDRERFIVADVVGHGLGATASAIAISSILRAVHVTLAQCKKSVDVGTYLAAVSTAMRSDRKLGDQLVTVLGFDRFPDGSIEFASAAHPAPILVSRDDARPVAETGPLLGIVADVRYPTQRIHIAEGQRVAVITDGVEPVWASSGGALPERLLEAVRATLDSPLDLAIERVQSWANGELGPSPKDDWTIMLIGGVGSAG